MGPGITRPGSPSLVTSISSPLFNVKHNWKYFPISTDEEIFFKDNSTFLKIIPWFHCFCSGDMSINYWSPAFSVYYWLSTFQEFEPFQFEQHWLWVHFTTWSRLTSIPKSFYLFSFLSRYVLALFPFRHRCMVRGSKFLLTKLSWPKNLCGHCLQNHWGEFYFVSGRHGSLNGFSLFALNVRLYNLLWRLDTKTFFLKFTFTLKECSPGILLFIWTS